MRRLPVLVLATMVMAPATLGCATGTDVYRRAVVAQTEQCRRLAEEGNAGELRACRDRLDVLRQMEKWQRLDEEATLAPPPNPPGRDLLRDAVDLQAVGVTVLR